MKNRAIKSSACFASRSAAADDQEEDDAKSTPVWLLLCEPEYKTEGGGAARE
jgi:hypothetical protein